MKVEYFVVGPIDVNCYVISDDNGIGAVIDPGGNAERILAYIKKENLDIRYVLNTHGHGDHIGADDAVRDGTGAPLYIHAADADMLTDARKNLSAFMGYQALARPADVLLHGGEEITVGDIKLKVVCTPGHSAGGVCFVGDGFVFSGDALFADSIGRTDFPGGSQSELVSSIKRELMVLPDETEVYPGHGPKTTIGWEKVYNPYLQW
ncbi:MBL fold metallo-hydrolase [Schwartzia succinivorans]|jgi:glyoxylase-like metal-dependent hydrolase (beta-lactamase superfamily II)|uniref:Glyoxylase, beta-lactamase superfamily II n=1 Tax=Schwartzia succinivorans DSM 10502 TaxID=1123243 RepID=A0A1M4V911_9FIRM|nr:MBL fold metallo-hydrolase [Schwartzia succinivorans]SHE65422.1 Glyoxylase, beta-lactamase superfamily II [Schwartzia succinivorans DSM 10502]